MDPYLVSKYDNQELCKEISDAEAIGVIDGIDSNKGLGLYGFLIHFFNLVGSSLNKTYQKC